MNRKRISANGALLALLLASNIYLLAADETLSASSTPANTPVAKTSAATPANKAAAHIRIKPSPARQSPISAKSPSAVGAPTHYKPSPLSGRAKFYYDAVWGVDSLKLKYAESGEMVRFSYRILDPVKAKPLNDKKNEPSLIDPRAGVKLVVPSMEKIGKLRQSSPPETGKMYWMAFSNKGRLVKPGDLVNVVIGRFHANGLVVE